jgi:hypothetical protein
LSGQDNTNQSTLGGIMEVKKIEAFSLAEFAKLVQEAFKQGFQFDFETNENYPTTFGSYYVAGMVKKSTEQKISKTKSS